MLMLNDKDLQRGLEVILILDLEMNKSGMLVCCSKFFVVNPKDYHDYWTELPGGSWNTDGMVIKVPCKIKIYLKQYIQIHYCKKYHKRVKFLNKMMQSENVLSVFLISLSKTPEVTTSG